MSATVLRWRTLRAYERALAERGKEHPSTIAAYARAVEAWDKDRVRPSIAPWNPLDSQSVRRWRGVYLRAAFRARGMQGFENRGMRFARTRNAYATL